MINGLLSEAWCEALASYTRLWVGYSGGLDSTVLLHALKQVPQLATQVQAVHVNHGISPHAANWQAHCQAFCKQLAIPLKITSVEFERRWNVEEHARKARYQVFYSLLESQDCLLLAHHADDQAETVLLQLFRGAGVDGLSAMLPLKSTPQGFVARPFLHHYKSALHGYAVANGLAWIEDESNQDPTFSRNFLRHTIIPLLRPKWPGVIGNLARSAQHCQQAQANLDRLAKLDCETLTNQTNQLKLTPHLLQSGRDGVVNVLRVWLKNNNAQQPSSLILTKIIEEVIEARSDAKPQVAWGGYLIRRYRDTLYLLSRSSAQKRWLQPKSSLQKRAEDASSVAFSKQSIDWTDFPAPLLVTQTTEQRYYLHATPAACGLYVPRHSKVRVASRQGSVSFYWHGQHKQLKKLLQQWQVVPWERDTIPLIYINDCLAQVVGYAVSDLFYANTDAAHSPDTMCYERDRIYRIEWLTM